MTQLLAYVDAETAAVRLKVSRPTLYAYVSRGLVRAHPHPDDPRARLYSVADIDRLVTRKTQQRRPADAAAGALDWGLPALDTHISDIAGGRLSYRGIDAIAFSQTATLEAAADLLWEVPLLADARFHPDAVAGWRSTSEAHAADEPLMRALTLLPLLLDQETPGMTRARFARRGGILVKALACALVPDTESDRPIHDALAAAWRRPDMEDAIRQALVLIADHEMNASSFAVRVAASTDATPTASIIAGLATLSGPRHGGAVARVAALVDEAERAGGAEAAVRARLARGEAVPGFGHPLYPEGDPRAAALLARIDDPLITGLIDVAEAETGLRPTVDVALCALERAYGLPAGAGVCLFATGRSVGWIAHAMEQRESGRLIRPRARFVADEAL